MSKRAPRLSIAACLLLGMMAGCARRSGEQLTPRRPVSDGGKVASPPASTLARAPAVAPRVVEGPSVLVRLAEKPDPGLTGVRIPYFAELPSGEIVIAGSSWETDLGPGAERVADGFVAAYGPDGMRRWLCLSSATPDPLLVEAAGGVHVALSVTGAAGCKPGFGGPRGEDRWGAPRSDVFWNVVHVALDARGTPRWSTPYSSAGVALALRTAVGDHGTVLLFGYGSAPDTFTLSALDAAGRLRWSRRGPKVDTNSPTRLPELAISAEGTVVMFTGVFTGGLDATNISRPSPLPPMSLVKLDASGRVAWSDPMTLSDRDEPDDRLFVSGVTFDGDDVLVLGHATRAMKLGGQLVACTPEAPMFLARLDALGRARWARVLPRSADLDPDQAVQLLRASNGGVIVVGRSYGPPVEDGEREVRISLVRLEREGREATRRSLSLHDVPCPTFAASAAGDSVLIGAAVKTVEQVQSLFPGSSIRPAPSSVAILVGRISM
jgi:hypothetical protein